MRNDRLIPGGILIIIGALFLLDNFGMIHFHWINLISLWPIILVIAGVNLIFAHNQSGWATVVKLLVLIAGLAFLIYGGLDNHYRSNWNYGFNWNDDHNNNNQDNDDNNDSDSDSTTVKDSVVKIDGTGRYNEAYKPAIQTARLNISGGGASYRIKDITNELFEADTKEYAARYNLKTHQDGATEVLDFDMNGRRHMNFGSETNTADIKLNTNPEWEVNLETGAAKIDFDLSNYKVRKLKIEGGAASFDVKMGAPLATTNVDISTGVSAVTIGIPQNAACRITTDTGLSSKNFDGFNKKDDDTYETAGFDKAANKIYISMRGGISDFKVNRY